LNRSAWRRRAIFSLSAYFQHFADSLASGR
jgi:hypothetical protein